MLKTVPLKKNYEFIRTYKRGKFYVGKYIILYVMKNNMNINRLGISISKKVGKSNKRNRIRRIVRENYRLYEEIIKDGYDIVFVGRTGADLPDFINIKKEMKFLLKKLEIFDQEKWDCLKGS